MFYIQYSLVCTYWLQGQLHLTLLTCIKITENAIQANEYFPSEMVLILQLC